MVQRLRVDGETNQQRNEARRVDKRLRKTNKGLSLGLSLEKKCLSGKTTAGLVYLPL